MAAFKNPEFYKAQAMRMPTFKKPRIISCSDETEQYLILPRGCASDLSDELSRLQVQSSWTDEACAGKSIQVEFTGTLREEQQEVVSELLKYDDGVLAATTAFGKTVIAAKLIAERKVNTLILVHRQQLLAQWITRLSEFLLINEKQPVIEQKNGRKKKPELIGRLAAGKDQLSGIIDVALMQSFNVDGEVRDCVKNYGMIIVDECHHIPAVSFAEILKKSNAKYIHGLTATPARKDGHHPIIFMYCGPVRFRVDAIKQAQKRPFEHFVIPRFTGFRVTRETSDKDFTIQDLYSEIVKDELRNQLIVEDVFTCHEEGRHCLVLTERTAHVDILSKMIAARISGVIALKGGLGVKETNSLLKQVTATPSDKQLTIVATGKFIGEGFDEARLDTLFLAMPISWKGTLQQYAGRLHRLSDNKKEVRVYDYVDVRVGMLEKMYNKRLNGYAAIGYQAKGDGPGDDAVHIIYDKRSFFAVYSQDIIWAKKSIFVVSPFITPKRVAQILLLLQEPLARKVEVTIVTRPANEFAERFKTALEQTIVDLKQTGVRVVFKPKIHQKFAIVDQKIVWYGSINLLSFGASEESMMRLVSSNIALELTDSL
jgi:superfamily II DNA or RNA helicase